MKRFSFLIYLLSAGLILGQHFSLKEAEKKALLVEAVKLLSTLAHDSMEGREAGTRAEIKAANFIKSYLKSHHISPYLKTYEDTFIFYKPPTIKNAILTCANRTFTYPQDFVFYSASQNDKGLLTRMNSNEVFETNLDQAALIVLCPSLKTQQDSIDLYTHLDDIFKKTQYSHNQTYIFSVDPRCKGNLPPNFISPHLENKNFLLLTSEPITEYLAKQTFPISFELYLEFNPDTIAISRNILAWIDNKAPTTIVLGAHYDHLGYGLQNSRYIGPRKIHNGADDNGSGTVLLMLLAKYLNNHRDLFGKHNYLIAFFSGEEKGLLGSKHVAKKYMISKPLAMINFDMVGRLDTLQRPLHILGTATSPFWDSILPSSTFVKKLPSSIRGSDQYSFYQQQIPVLFFFTGMHSDYHTPNDDVDKINFFGIIKTMEYALQLLNNLQQIRFLSFQNVQEDTTTRHVYAKYSLGIVPDFSWNGKGVRVDEVIPNKIAFQIGMKKNDIIVQLNNTAIENIHQYMKALSEISADHENEVVILRDGQTMKFTFKVN